MKAAVVRAAGAEPVWADHPEPRPAADEVLVRVAAAALSPLARGRASGRHYSAAAHGFPLVPGVDGIGRTGDGRRVYVAFPRPPGGTMAERVAVPVAHCAPVPDALDDIAAAALANPGMSSWAALTERAAFHPGETVLVNGATGSAGQLAVRIARHLGAARVLATGRDRDRLAATGADATIPLDDDAPRRFEAAFADGVDVVLDYLWGASAAALLAAAASRTARPVRMVQIGSASGGAIELPGATLRSAPITLLGSGLGSVALPRLVSVIGALFEAAGAAGLAVETAPVPMEEIERTWSAGEGAARTVFTIDAD